MQVIQSAPSLFGKMQGAQVRLSTSASPLRPAIVAALDPLPDETVIDGEVVALDAEGRPSFNALQNFGSGASVVYYVFDVLVLGGRDVMSEPLTARRELLRARVLPALSEPVRKSPILDASASQCLLLNDHSFAGFNLDLFFDLVSAR
ncbi:MAG: hypothetical protein ACLQVN_14200 [Bryobacteraceae bacterium]